MKSTFLMGISILLFLSCERETVSSCESENPFLNPMLTYGCLTDIEGNHYATIQIGEQTWMAENLRTAKYNDGRAIPHVIDNVAWESRTSGAWAYYDNDASYNELYGKLYNWHTVKTGKLCPAGWHIPTDEEWTVLADMLGGGNDAGGKMKVPGNSEEDTRLWDAPNTAATNESGFTALPGGFRSFNGLYHHKGKMEYWWTASDHETFYKPHSAWNRFLHYNFKLLNRYEEGKILGFSCRCIKD